MRLFDLHCDTLYECDRQNCELWENTLDLDVKRGLAMDAFVQVFAAFIPDELRGTAAQDHGLRLLDLAAAQAEIYSQLLPVKSAADLDAAAQTHRCGMLLAVEGGAVLGGELSMVDELAKRGVKLLTLTWNGDNELACGCMSGRKGGLSDFGKAALLRMGEVGILPDVSHLNEAGFWDVAETVEGPFLATHSLSAAVCSHPRNLTDAQFDCIRDRGGLVGLNLCTAHLGVGDFAAFERHLAHFLERDGAHTVAMGCDLDGTTLPPEWPGIDTLSALWRQLLQDGFGTETCDRLFYKNAYEFFHSL